MVTAPAQDATPAASPSATPSPSPSATPGDSAENDETGATETNEDKANSDATPAEGEDSKDERDRLTQLQIFLDDANFGPGKIDGRWGEFSRKSLALYLQSQDKEVPEFTDEVPSEFPVDVSSIEPIYTEYEITQEDIDSLGEVPSEPEDQAKQDKMPYENLTELVAEKYHVDRDYLATLNEGTAIDDAKAGDKIAVPNVKVPFNLADVRARAESESEESEDSEESNESDEKDASDDEEKGENTAEASPSPVKTDALSILISTADRMLELRENDQLIAAFPITPGSDSLPAPVGEWKITGISMMPWFRHDEKMLKEGERSDEAHNIPPGPNNAVGIAWMAINKEGIGIHGTPEPDTIGRSASHGCIRLANWDAARLSEMIEDGTPVKIEE